MAAMAVGMAVAGMGAGAIPDRAGGLGDGTAEAPAFYVRNHRPIPDVARRAMAADCGRLNDIDHSGGRHTLADSRTPSAGRPQDVREAQTDLQAWVQTAVGHRSRYPRQHWASLVSDFGFSAAADSGFMQCRRSAPRVVGFGLRVEGHRFSARY